VKGKGSRVIGKVQERVLAEMMDVVMKKSANRRGRLLAENESVGKKSLLIPNLNIYL